MKGNQARDRNARDDTAMFVSSSFLLFRPVAFAGIPLYFHLFSNVKAWILE